MFHHRTPTKEPYAIMNCPLSLLLASSLASSVHTSPWHKVRHRNFIFDIHMHMYTPCMHIKYLMILTCSFSMAAILAFFFDLLSAQKAVIETSYHMFLSISFTYIHKRNYATVTYFLKFVSILLKFIHSLLL